MSNELDQKVTYLYDNERRLNQILDVNKNIIFQTSYDDYNRAVFQQNRDAEITKNYNLFDHTENIFISSKNLTKEFDEKYRLLKIKDSLNNQLFLNYEKDNITPSQISDENGNKFEFKYDDFGHLTYLKDPFDGERFYYYDNQGNLNIEKNPNCNAYYYVYDLNGNIRTLFHKTKIQGNDITIEPAYHTNFNYDSFGNLIQIINAFGNTTSYAYNDVGCLIKIKTPEGYTLHREIDDKGRVTKIFDDTSYFINYKYDQANRIVSIASKAGEICYTYDNANNITSFTDPNNFTTFYEYDRYNNLIKVIDAEGNNHEKNIEFYKKH